MRTLVATLTATAVSTAAFGAGLERSTQSVAILFEEGTYAEFGFSMTNPNVSGALPPASGGLASGQVLEDFETFTFGLKTDLSPQWSLAFVVDNPVGADVSYPATQAPYPFAGSTATVSAINLTAMAKYQATERFSLIGGARIQRLDGNVFIPAFNSYNLTVDQSYKLGAVVGAAYEIPDIALRVALTHNTGFDHDFDATESSTAGTGRSNFTTTIPQSWNLEWQTGIAEDTLLFGSVRWVEWSKFNIAPPIFGARLAFLNDDYTSYTLGLGRRFSDEWAGSITLGHEPAAGTPQGNLGPTDGADYVQLGLSRTIGKTEISGGLRYTQIGDTVTTTIGSNFTDNTALTLGFRVGHRF